MNEYTVSAVTEAGVEIALPSISAGSPREALDAALDMHGGGVAIAEEESAMFITPIAIAAFKVELKSRIERM